MAMDFGRITDALLDLLARADNDLLTEDEDMPPYWVSVVSADDLGADVLNVAIQDEDENLVAGYRVTVERVDLD